MLAWTYNTLDDEQVLSGGGMFNEQFYGLPYILCISGFSVKK